MNIRSPIIAVLGHVDHGKSSILDAIRGTNIVAGEAGAITQAIGASIIPTKTIIKRCGPLIDQLKMKITIPGLLFVDTPGHAAFTSLRKRGGSLADIAIVVVDINEGFKPQTIEAIEVLKSFKTPFIIAANKVDLVAGFKCLSDSFLASFSKQSEQVQQLVEQKTYEIVGTVYDRFGLQAERFDRVSDYTSQVAIVPCSAKQQLGLNEMLMVLMGLSQKYLEQNLKLNVSGSAKGIILEVKEDKGLGKTIDVILYDGSLKRGSNIVVGTLGEPKICKVRALLMPEELKDMRDKKSRFSNVNDVAAATGVKISSPDFDDTVIAGMPLFGANPEEEESAKTQARAQVNEVLVETDKRGIIIKADTLGGLEAMIKMLKEKNIPVRKALIGNITRKDITDAESNIEQDPSLAAILGFNVKSEEESKTVKILTNEVIYGLIDDLEAWRQQKREEIEAKELDKVVLPGKVEVLKNCIFRQSNPCIAGIEIIEGQVKPGTKLMDKGGGRVAEIKELQADKENLAVATRGRQLAASMPGATAGRQIHEGEIYYTDISEDDFRKLKKLAKHLSKPDLELLKEIAAIKRKDNPVWGV